MRVLPVFFILCLLTASWSSVHAAQQISDDQIYDEVRRRLTNDPDVKGGTLSVEVKKGVVTLRGQVDLQKHKIKAERITRKVRGVKKVINELKLALM